MNMEEALQNMSTVWKEQRLVRFLSYENIIISSTTKANYVVAAETSVTSKKPVVRDRKSGPWRS